jgi:ABC-type Fe3+ transport system substrate-binding protein
MEIRAFSQAAILFFVGTWVCSTTVVAQSSAALSKAKAEAETRGYIFETSRDAIIEKAKKEGKLVVFSSQDADTIRAAADAFRKKYPFIDVKATEIAGTDTYRRMIQELALGKPTGWDVNYVAFDYYKEYLPHQKKFDLLAMAKHGVLQMPVDMIDPVNRHIIALQTNMQVLAYNKKLVPENKTPATYEDMLKPEYKGRKFATDVRPRAIAALVPAWGLEKVLVYAKRLAAQDPIWTRGDSRTLPYMTSGEISMNLGLNYKSYLRFKEKDIQDILAEKILEPIPVRLTEAEGVSATAQNPYAGLLWLEFQASPEAQAILDKVDRAASHLITGTFHEKAIRGKKVSLLSWEHYQHMGKYEEEVVKAFGFPRADK